MATNPPEIAMNPPFQRAKKWWLHWGWTARDDCQVGLASQLGSVWKWAKIHLQVANATGKMWENDGKVLYKPSEYGGTISSDIAIQGQTCLTRFEGLLLLSPYLGRAVLWLHGFDCDSDGFFAWGIDIEECPSWTCTARRQDHQGWVHSVGGFRGYPILPPKKCGNLWQVHRNCCKKWRLTPNDKNIWNIDIPPICSLMVQK